MSDEEEQIVNRMTTGQILVLSEQASRNGIVFDGTVQVNIREEETLAVAALRAIRQLGVNVLDGDFMFFPGAAKDNRLAIVNGDFVERIPLSGNSMEWIWEPGERVECVARHEDPPRPGTVVAIDEILLKHERLRVKFDDGEERHINPDVMRHIDPSQRIGAKSRRG